jgi:ribosomal protein S18 acetylase RimI-like enzyme
VAMLQIRSAAIHDLPGAYRVCLLTGDMGRDGSALFRDPDLLGHVYVGPYIVGQRGMQLVVVDEAGVAGYLLTADDSRAFETWAEATWWPLLRARYPLRADGSADAEVDGSADAELVRLIHHPVLAPDDVVAGFPAHLHIDLLERARGKGLGRALIERSLNDLRGQGVRGVHLDVAAGNQDAIGFYEHLGFQALHADRDGMLMGMRLG